MSVRRLLTLPLLAFAGAAVGAVPAGLPVLQVPASATSSAAATAAAAANPFGCIGRQPLASDCTADNTALAVSLFSSPPLVTIAAPSLPFVLTMTSITPPSARAAARMAARQSSTADGDGDGHDILRRFHDGLAQPGCEADRGQDRWRQHFSHAPELLAEEGGEVLGLFGHVVDALRAAHLPTEFALIPFVESGYRPGARSAGGPAGLWQFIALTARNHKIPIRPGYDGRLSAVDSTRAAVRYLKTLYGMFGGDWRLAAMAFNAGEHRILRAMRQTGVSAADARPAELPGLPPVTQAYVEKLHALACVIDGAADDEDWRRALERAVLTEP